MPETASETLTDRLDELDRWLTGGDLDRAVRRHRLGERVRELAAALERHREQFDSLGVLASVADLSTEADSEAVRKDAQRLYKAASDLARLESPESVKEWLDFRLRDVLEVGDRLHRELQGVWQRRCARAFTDHGRIGQVLSRFPATVELGKAMTQTAASGIALAARFPPSRSDRQTFETLEAECADQRARLAESGGAESIKRLLLAVAEGKATLADVTPELWEWLKRQGALGLFAVKLSP